MYEKLAVSPGDGLVSILRVFQLVSICLNEFYLAGLASLCFI